MNILLQKQNAELFGEIFLNGSKSISNRLLLINNIGKLNLQLHNLCNATDTEVLQAALRNLETEVIDIKNCGTAMRFLTALLAFVPGKRTITGDKRMQLRPIKPLVDALQNIGANIQFANQEGFPPLVIEGSFPEQKHIKINASLSSQFVSAIMLTAPLFETDVVIELVGKVVSTPYLKMTLHLMKEFGIESSFDMNLIFISKGNYQFSKNDYNVEGDWSSASYWYSAVALSNKANIKINRLNTVSSQGDSLIKELYSFFGVTSKFEEGKLVLQKSYFKTDYFMFDFCDNPDLAPTIAVTCAGLKIPSEFSGLDNLNSKESERIETIASELSKCGVKCKSTSHSLKISGFDFDQSIKIIDTHNDHRIAMSFLPLSFIMPLKIINTEVIRKSYPNFLNDAAMVGFKFETEE